MSDRKIYNEIKHMEPITKGWSEDKKYCVTTTDDTKYLLRITSISRYETRKSLFELLEQLAKSDIPMCKPIEFGICESGAYNIQSWIYGEDLEEVLPLLSETEQYTLGLKSGEILRNIHTITAPDTQEEWAPRFNRKTNTKINRYRECGFHFDGDENIIAYIERNRHLFENRPQCFQHGDYHVGNMMIENSELIIIDFDRYDFGDPWEEFNRIVWSAAASPHFATGQLRGYFGGEPPMEFFKLLAFYIASNTLSSVSWAVSFSSDANQYDIMLRQAQDILDWFDNMQNPIPTWYLKNFCVQWIDGIPYKLKEPYDFSFISKYGKVFKVFDEQGINVCFGVVNGDDRYFVKFAGAKPTNFDYCNGDTVFAVNCLKQAVSVYRHLEHPSLIKFIESEEIGGGYAAIFEWTDAIGIEPLNSPDYMRFMQMPIENKIRAFEDIMDFHAHVAEKGYVALDFYDGSIMYDYDKEKVIICDIDFYQKAPYIGDIGLWGSTRFVSPEECTHGAVMDEITIVYTMGATAFSLFAYGNRSLEAWSLNQELYDVVKKAVSDERNKRQQSIEQLISEWRVSK